MRLRHIEVFYAVYSAGSVTHAAEVLNVSQPSVSKVLAHAEQQLGYRLFDRVKGKLVPTPEADQLYNHVREVNDSLDRMRHVAENLRKAKQGRVRIAATPAFGIDVLPGANCGGCGLVGCSEYAEAVARGGRAERLVKHIKAVTYHNLEIKESNYGLVANIVFDV